MAAKDYKYVEVKETNYTMSKSGFALISAGLMGFVDESENQVDKGPRLPKVQKWLMKIISIILESNQLISGCKYLLSIAQLQMWGCN